MLDTPAILVCDADWADNSQVLTPTSLLRSELRSIGVKTVLIAAPPTEPRGAPSPHTGKTQPLFKGADDFYGAGFTPDDLVVFNRGVPRPAFDEWVERESGNPRGLRGRWREVLSATSGSWKTSPYLPMRRVDSVCRSEPLRTSPVGNTRSMRLGPSSRTKRPGLTSEHALWVWTAYMALAAEFGRVPIETGRFSGPPRRGRKRLRSFGLQRNPGGHPVRPFDLAIFHWTATSRSSPCSDGEGRTATADKL